MQNTKRARDAKGWTQAALARRSGVDAQTISRIENGRLNPTVAVARRIASALGVTIDSLVHGEDGSRLQSGAPETTEAPALDPCGGNRAVGIKAGAR